METYKYNPSTRITKKHLPRFQRRLSYMPANIFIQNDASNETNWRAIILQGKNTASYKFALAQALLTSQHNQSSVTLKDLAIPFALNVAKHLANNPKQTVGNRGIFLTSCDQFNSGVIEEDELQAITEKHGFKYVLDAFHNIAGGEVGARFFDNDATKKSITLTDEFYELVKGKQLKNLEQEVEARWKLWETAISLNISANLLIVNNDSTGGRLFIRDYSKRRVDVTSPRDALNGYQKGKCFYCNTDISVIQGVENSCDVDHFFPESLKFPDIDCVWNLVLACKSCNRWDKSARIPNTSLLQKLNTRNEYFITSHHPLSQTIINQTGSTPKSRSKFLQKYYNAAFEIIPVHFNPTQVDKDYL